MPSTVKVLFDPVLTAEPAKCSTTVQYVTWARRLIEAGRTDIFITWIVPDWVSEEEFLSAYPQSPQIRYVRLPQHKDRTKEYLTLRDAMDRLIAFNGECWDFDAILTVRTGLVPLMKLLMSSPRQRQHTWAKKIWLIEEMPLMTFKKTVMTIDSDVQDRFTMEGYLAADRVFVLSYHEKPEIVQRARDFYTPSTVKLIADKLHPVCTTQFSDFRLLPESRWFDRTGDAPLVFGHAGRMEMANNIAKVSATMMRQMAMKGSKVRALVCTQSRTTKVFDDETVDIRMASRAEFWKACEDEMHLILKMSPEGGFTLTLLEPMMLGVPTIVMRAPWVEGLLGADYPFYVSNEVQAYALVSAFYEDYAGMYARWSDWHINVFRPMFEARFKTDLLYELLDKAAEEAAGIPARFAEQYPNRAKSFVTDTLLTWLEDKDEFVLFDAVRALGESGAFTALADKTKAEDRDRRNLVWATPWNEIRLALKAHHGWVDASPAVGHLRRA